jgi:signal transduction histidine kinase
LSRKALEPLQEAIRSQEAFIADASHQLKTPLAILRGEVDLMRSKPRSAEEIRDFLRSVSQEVTHLSRMIEDLLLLARTDAPAASRMIEAVRLDEVLLELIPKFQKLAEARQVRLALNFADQATFEIRGEPMLVRAAIGNVLDNAVKYATPGSQVSVELGGDKDAVVVQVWNAGEAIPPEAMARIFERFFRAESDEHGSGLGLSIVKRILDIHQGEVALENREGVSVELGGDKDAVVVQVWNAGEAIPPEAMARIFERFFRAESDEHGSGLGLSIVKRILDIHQGEVALENREGGILCRLRFRRGLKNF